VFINNEGGSFTGSFNKDGGTIYGARGTDNYNNANIGRALFIAGPPPNIWKSTDSPINWSYNVGGSGTEGGAWPVE
jgi:hypothetical protein